MSYHIEDIPGPHDRTNHSKGNGGKRGRIDGHTFMPNDLGVSFTSGLGCSRHTNCFTCQIPDCKYGCCSGSQDWRFLSNRGNGIGVKGVVKGE